MEKYQRAHPVTIISNLGRVFYLIIIPVLRGFVSALRGDITSWLKGAWMDIIVFMLMLGIAVLIWFLLKFRYDDKQIEVVSGLFRRRRIYIPWGQITTVTLLESFYLRPFRALRFRVDTLGGSFKDADFTIFLFKRQAQAILDSRTAFAGEALGKVYQPTTSSIVALSILTSNSFGGILYISTFISQSGKLLGKGFSQMIIGTFEQASRDLAFGIPPAAASIGYILLAGWLFGFFLSFVRYKNFTLTRKKNILSINGGIFTKREYSIRYSDINFIDIQQSMVTKLLKLYSLYLSATGYGKQKNDISCIIPTESVAKFEKSRVAIFPALNPAPRQFTPESKGFMRFLGQPLLALAGIASALGVFLRLFPLWGGFIWFVGLMAAVPASFFLCIRLIDFMTCGLTLEDNNYTMRYSSGLSLHTVVIPEDKVVSVELRQSFFQKFGRYCDVIVCSRAERRYRHRCCNLVKADMVKLFGIV